MFLQANVCAMQLMTQFELSVASLNRGCGRTAENSSVILALMHRVLASLETAWFLSLTQCLSHSCTLFSLHSSVSSSSRIRRNRPYCLLPCRCTPFPYSNPSRFAVHPRLKITYILHSPQSPSWEFVDEVDVPHRSFPPAPLFF